MKLCDYGCGKKANYKLKNGKMCCEKHPSKCSCVKSKNNKHLKGIRKNPQSDKTKLKISDSLKGKKHTVEQNKRQSERMKKYWNNKKTPISLNEYPFCECGCGERVSKPHNRFILGHHTRVIDCSWQRGFTKETHPSLKKISEKLKGRTKENHIGVKQQAEKMKGKVPWMKGKNHTKESKMKMSKSILELDLIPWNKGKTKETSKRMKIISEKLVGITRGPNKKLFSDKVRKNQRLGAIKRIESKCGQLSPNYNPYACKLIDQYGKENGYNFQHAENGGEFHVSGLGYWVDGYDKEKNVVIEIDESFHFNSDGNLKERDIIRQIEITQHLKCEFIRIRI